MIDQLVAGDRRSLAQAITLVESTRDDQRKTADQLLEKVISHSGSSLRLGISGAPGVGKSTFIEKFGLFLIEKKFKVAVLTIDPSSPISGGSILGDKTRMPELSANESAFIRPSPSKGSLGGVARRTREAILLCEAAGYNFVIVETVGVGQSEVIAASMVDVFLMLQQPNAGDELQGIKKGILELADIVAITKCDGDLASAAERTRLEQQRALTLVRGHEDWKIPVLSCSGVNGDGIDNVYQAIDDHKEYLKSKNLFHAKRAGQVSSWFQQELSDQLREMFLEKPEYASHIEQHRQMVIDQKLPASSAARKLIASLV